MLKKTDKRVLAVRGRKFSKPHLSRIVNGDIELPAEPLQEQKTRLDMALLAEHPEYNRSVLQKYIKAGQVQVNGAVVTKANTMVGAEDELAVEFPEMLPRPEVPVIYEDENVLVVNKPAGLLSISKGDFNPEPSMEDFGLIVHRLDRDTSGVMIVAKNEETRAMLQRQFQQRKTRKKYYAVVVGEPELPAAVINVPLARNLRQPTTFQADPDGREAITEYQVLAQNGKYSLLELRPQTGRTHQLRVHLAHIGTPILGDPIYGNGKTAERMFLHAGALEITIPWATSDDGIAHGERRVFQSEMPTSFRQMVK